MFETQLAKIQKKFKNRVVDIVQPESEFPELDVTVPDSWDQIQLAPLYDVHFGNTEQDEKLLKRHLNWIAETPNVLSWDGGDMIENITPAQGKMGHTVLSPQEQVETAIKSLALVQHKLMFKLPGNHEARTFQTSQMSSSKYLADCLQLPHFSDYCFLHISWRGQNFRILAHHGAGGAQTPGAQLNSARKDLAWTTADIIWTGHLHQNRQDVIYRVDYDQKTGRAFERDALVIISPSYVKYFGGYSAAARMAPGVRGLAVAILNPDGRIDANIHARGKRL
jgi:hypothetical protein